MSMKQDFTLEVAADNNFSVLNRIINVLNRRRVRIKKLMAHENENDFRRGGVIMLLFTTSDMIEKVYECPFDKCGRTYGSDVSLNLHMKLKHNSGTKT